MPSLMDENGGQSHQENGGYDEEEEERDEFVATSPGAEQSSLKVSTISVATGSENGEPAVRRNSVTFSQASPEEITISSRREDDDYNFFYNDDDSDRYGDGFIHNNNSRRILQQAPSSRQRMEDYRRSSSQRQSFKSDDLVKESWKDVLPYAYYIAMFSVCGAVLRAYMGRFFGLDCEYSPDDETRDFLTPLSSRICVTNSGTTEQTGGALFIDLPANMLGAFYIGILSLNPDGLPLPWFEPDHPLQKHEAFQAGLSVGFCGCLTTFASWNTQMVVMLNGTETELGPQVAPALFGYLIGMACAVASFVFGRHTGGWLRAFTHHRPVRRNDDDDEEEGDNSISEMGPSWSDEEAALERRQDWPSRIWFTVSALIRLPISPFLLAAGLGAAFAVADAKGADLFYRKMWMIVALAPFGALLRWYLSDLNFRRIKGKYLGWVPWGTLSANLLASMVSVSAEAVDSHVLSEDDRNYEWLSPLMGAVELGFAGCLSTVSTMLRELFLMDTSAKAHIYWSFTVVCAMLISLTIYAPWVRSG